jgi:hypothetical protein
VSLQWTFLVWSFLKVPNMQAGLIKIKGFHMKDEEENVTDDIGVA